MHEGIFGPILLSLLRSGSFQATQHIWDPIVAHVSKHENAADVFLAGGLWLFDIRGLRYPLYGHNRVRREIVMLS
jgi:hypothetical protein